MKKIIALLLALTMVFALAACAKQTTETPATETTTTPETTTTEENTTTEETPAAETTEAADLKVGVFYYTFADTYISSVRTALDAQLDSLGVAYQNFDGNNNQTTQNEQIQTALTDGYNLLIVNMVTSGSPDVANEIISMANGTPVIFFNRAIEADGNEGTVLNANATISFIGTDAPEAGHLQGKMVGEYLLANWDTVDLNGDGKISYAMFKGDEANVEAIYRTQFGVEDANAVLTEAGKPELEYFDASNTSKYQVDLGGAWSAQAALDYMNTNLSQYNEANGNMIELIICNNDNMAEGAISALETAGYNTGAEGSKTIPVFGVDATDAAKELIAAGKMTGTVKQDAEGMAVAIASVVKATGEGTSMADAVAATSATNPDMYTIADGIANKLFVAYAAYTAE
ncbi:Galactose/methyl galactoside ABC transporter, substrate-binding protein MglB (EC 3.6.3.17) [Oscillospiraceae bacterium]|nr:Galactose/methyl galactoside ABC transporter, substrate-binding protein MglB (EC 3.6.3.17) [Oscillospiraceae bacterium]